MVDKNEKTQHVEEGKMPMRFTKSSLKPNCKKDLEKGTAGQSQSDLNSNSAATISWVPFALEGRFPSY